ncbi:MAG: hypothetical protein FWD64_02510, partial [Acidobacteriaceae bacterium]|nr:hypothetical protein [Acidobacteriaceae bacterium]
MKETGKCFVYLLVFLLLPLAARAQGSKPAEGARFAFPGNRQVEITSCAPGVFRLRLIRANSADAENENLMDRYQILPARDCRAVEPGARNADGILFKSTGGSLRYDESTGKASLLNASGKVVVRSVQLMPDQANAASKDDIEQREKTVANQYKDDIQASLALNNPGALAPMPPDAIATSLEKGFAVSAELEPGERFYGLGEPSTKHIQLRGEAYFNWVRYQLDEEPIPFLMSTNGWGIFVNTTWRNYFDVGKTNPDQLLVWGPEGNPDVYLITGENMPEMLNRYTALAGRAILLPKWAYGLHFGNFITSDQFEILDNALRFRQLHFPVDGFELEPGWMKQNYDFSTKKEWNTDRFYMQDWMRGKRRRPETFIGA